MPGVAPMDTKCFLVWALAAVGRTGDAQVELARAAALPDLERWHHRPVLVAAGRALLAGDAAGVDAAIGVSTGPMPFTVALMRIIGARVLGGDVGVPWLRDALDIYETTGATAHTELVRGLIREAGGPVPRRRRNGGVPAELAAHGVTRRESEVLQLVGHGLTNAEIADKLFLSVRTVETHVSSLLAKLHVRTRGQLTALTAPIAFDG